MDPIFLTCMVIAFFFTKGKVDTAAYANGKESPGVAKARLRHEAGGGARTATGKPKGPGALRLLAASRWANACAASKQRGDHKARRRRAWYDETAPLKDAAWREKKLRRLNNSDAARNRWATDRGLVDLSEFRDRKAEEAAWAENERRDAEAAATDPAAEPKSADTTAADSTAKPIDPVMPTDPATPTGDPAKSAEDAAADGKGEAKPDTPVGAEKAKESDVGCPWIPAGKSEPCGQRRYDGSPYCAEHHVVGRLTECLWSKHNRSEPQCPNLRASHQPYCEAHLAEHAKRAEATADKTQPTTPTNTTDAPQPEATGDTAPKAAAKPPAPTPTTEGTNTVYEQAVTRLIRAADQVAEYRADLASFADTLAGKKWGVEVTGPIQDMDGQLVAIEGTYRDLAGQMKHQGDQGSAAYDQAPWVPGPEAVLV